MAQFFTNVACCVSTAAPDVSLQVGIKGIFQVRASENLLLPATVYGVPTPEIKWHKNDGIEIQENDSVKLTRKGL